MAGIRSARSKRERGQVETLPSGALRVKLYAGTDPLSGRRHYLRETVPAGPNAEAEAEKVLIRFINEVNERRNPRTSATVNQLMDRDLDCWTSTRPRRSGTRESSGLTYVR